MIRTYQCDSHHHHGSHAAPIAIHRSDYASFRSVPITFRSDLPIHPIQLHACAPCAPIPMRPMSAKSDAPHMRVSHTRGHDSLCFVCLLCTRPHFVYNVRLHSTEPPVGGGNSGCRVPVLSTCACSLKRPSACVRGVGRWGFRRELHLDAMDTKPPIATVRPEALSRRA